MRRIWFLPAALAIGVAAVSAGCTKDDTPSTPGITYSQVDRMAIPAVNTVFIPSAQKPAFNAGSPSTDVSMFQATATATLNAIRAATDPLLPATDTDVSTATVVGIVLPDIVTIDFAQPLAFPNGRALDDDVIDVELSLVLNRSTASDAINANDHAFLGVFPYLAAPNP